MLTGHNPLTTPQPITILRVDHGGAAMKVNQIQAGDRTIKGSLRFDLAPGTTDLVLYFSGTLPPDEDSYLFTVTATAGTSATPFGIDAEVHRARREPIRHR